MTSIFVACSLFSTAIERRHNTRGGMIMATKAVGGARARIAVVLTCALAALPVCSTLGACSTGTAGQGTGSNDTTRIAKTLVKTASNDLVLSDFDLNPESSPVTISSDDPAYAEFVEGLKRHSGLDIERVTMQVNVVSSTGAVLGAGSNDSTNYVYTIVRLDAVVDSHDISYTEKDGFN